MTRPDYFASLSQGESRWWSWILGFWFIIIGWGVTSSFILSPVVTIAQGVDPELANDFINASVSGLADIDPVKLGLVSLGALVTTVMTAVFWLINRFTRDRTRVVFGGLTGLALASSIITSIWFLRLNSTPEIDDIFGQLMGVSPLTYMLMLLTFPAMLIGVYLVQKFIHHRSILSLHTALPAFNWKRALHAILIVFIVYSLIMAILHFTGLTTLSPTFDPSRFWIYALISLLFIPLQSATEEIVFRGYLNQGCVAVFKNKWIAYLLTSAAFASLHLSNPEAISAAAESPFIFVLTMSSYFLFGFLLCLVVEFDGGLEAAIGIHAANNLFAAIFVNYEGSALPTPSLFLTQQNVVIDLPVAIITLVIVLWILYRTRGGQASAAT